jgi:hypothetical protein
VLSGDERLIALAGLTTGVIICLLLLASWRV